MARSTSCNGTVMLLYNHLYRVSRISQSGSPGHRGGQERQETHRGFSASTVGPPRATTGLGLPSSTRCGAPARLCSPSLLFNSNPRVPFHQVELSECVFPISFRGVDRGSERQMTSNCRGLWAEATLWEP